jgi:hypothetical protein
MKVLAMTIAAGAALCSVMAVPASAIPMSNLAAAASGLALDQSVRSTRQYQRYRVRGSGGLLPLWRKLRRLRLRTKLPLLSIKPVRGRTLVVTTIGANPSAVIAGLDTSSRACPTCGALYCRTRASPSSVAIHRLE